MDYNIYYISFINFLSFLLDVCVCMFVRIQVFVHDFERVWINRFEWFKINSIGIDGETCWLGLGEGGSSNWVFERMESPIWMKNISLVLMKWKIG